MMFFLDWIKELPKHLLILLFLWLITGSALLIKCLEYKPKSEPSTQSSNTGVQYNGPVNVAGSMFNGTVGSVQIHTGPSEEEMKKYRASFESEDLRENLRRRYEGGYSIMYISKGAEVWSSRKVTGYRVDFGPNDIDFELKSQSTAILIKRLTDSHGNTFNNIEVSIPRDTKGKYVLFKGFNGSDFEVEFLDGTPNGVVAIFGIRKN
jgi:hypothetical protein